MRPASASSGSVIAIAVRPIAPPRPRPLRSTDPWNDQGKSIQSDRRLPGVVRLDDRSSASCRSPTERTSAPRSTQQLHREVERASAVGDVVDEQHPAAVEVGHVELGRKNLGRIEHGADAGVELDVERAAVLDAEPVRDRSGRQQTAAGDRDDDLGDEPVGEDGPGKVAGCLAEGVPRQVLRALSRRIPFSRSRAGAAGRGPAGAAPTARPGAS